ncbi:gliding motility-associated C-terminal domain-containing protein [Mucilaginibacter sp. AW1-3]
MPFKKILLVLSLLFVFTDTFSTVFVVTSNADSGPGTLRDALTQAAANGSAVKDYINFNIADQSIAGRTITLVSQLPDVSSNLVIDGTTQPGSAFGQTEAHVEVSTPFNNIKFTVFNGNLVDDVEFYGLYIHDYTDIGTSRPNLQQRIGINILNSSNIIFGSSGKGNLLRGFNSYSLYFESTTSIKIQNNLIGLNTNNAFDDPLQPGLFEVTAPITINKCNSILIGGDNTEGNVIFALVNISFFEKTSNNTLSIKSNNFGVLKDGVTTRFIFQAFDFVKIATIYANNYITDPTYYTLNGADVNILIQNNLIGNFGTGIYLNQLNGITNFYHNYFGVSRDLQTNLNNNNSRPNLGNSVTAMLCNGLMNFGTNNNSDLNYFYNQSIAVNALGTPNTFLRYNDFKCLSPTGTAAQTFYSSFKFAPNNQYTLPNISILSLNTNGIHNIVNGTATPNATIDIYSSESCLMPCSIRSYVQTVTAGSSGAWQADILNLNGIFYASATLNNQTSLFKTFEINSDNVVIKPMRCSDLATISGLKVPLGVSYYWTDYNNNIVSTDLDLNIHKTGQYHLVLGGGCITSQWFNVVDDRVSFYDGSLAKQNASCSQSTGSIKGLFVYDPESKLKDKTWTDGNGNIVATSTDATNLPPGSYTLKVTTTDGCQASYGPITLSNTTGPNIDQSSANISPSNCGSSSGSITNVKATGTGTITYIWKNSQQQTVATTPNLTGQPAGAYTLQITDQSSCGYVTSSPITIPEANGIAIDTSAKTQTQAICGQNNGGSITNIKVTGATTYQWIDAGGNTVSTQLNLTNVAAGRYYLIASNAFCSKQTMVFTVTQQTNTVNYLGLTKKLINATCGLNNGSIQVIFMNNPPVLPVKYRWVDSKGQTLGTSSATLSNIDAGTYAIYATDNNGCEKYLISYSIGRDPALTVTTNNVQTVDDHCQTGTGSITGIGYTGKAPIGITWTDASGSVIANTIDLTNVKAGAYNVKITDGAGCEQDLSYTIQNVNSAVPQPLVNNIQLCTAGAALIAVNNPSPSYGFKLYDSATSSIPITQSTTGKFNVSVSAARSYFISQYIGTCESARAEVKIGLGLSKLSIANTFTPNNDGINDTWKINGMENYPDGTVQIYNRTGQLIFESKGYTISFNGRFKGQDLPLGTYYYIINLNTKCEVISGSITLVR